MAIARSVGIWIRVSTEDQVKGESPEHHEHRARSYADMRGWKVAEVYRLDGISGKAIIDHPEAKRMLADLRSGRIEALIFSKLARLARNTRELLDFADIFRDCGTDMVSLAEAIDTSSPAGRLFFTLLAAMAQWEREEISARVAASVPVRAAMGKPTGGAAPYGYRWVDKRLEIDPEEAPVRVLMYELFAEHRRLKRVARILNERGYRTRRDAKFADTTIRRLIEDGTAKGLRRANYTQTTDRTKSWTLKPESEWVYQQSPAIVSEDLWQRCNDLLAAQNASLRKPGRKAVHLFAGYAFCACGPKMYVWSNSPKYQCPTCRNKIPVDDLEAVYRDQLKGFVFSDADLEAHAEAANEVIREKAALIEAAEADLRKITSEDDRLYQLYLADALTKEDFGRRHRPLAERRDQLEFELPRLQAELDVLRIGSLDRQEAISEARDLTTRWDGLAFEDKRQIVEAITDRIVIGKEEVEINLLHIPMSRNDAEKATHAHGFWAAISWTLAGYRT